MPKVTFFLRSKKKELHNTYLYCRVSINSIPSEFSLNEKIDPQYWNQKTQLLESPSKQMNSYISLLMESTSLKLKTKAIAQIFHNPKELIASLNEKPKVVTHILLTDVITKFIESQKGIKSPGTIRNYEIKLKNLQEYQKSKKIKFSINDPDRKFDLPEAECFTDWFRSTRKTKNVRSASRNILFFRQGMQFAVKKGYIKDYELKLYETENDPAKTPVFLTSDEVKKLIDANLVSKPLIKVRDLYLFQIGTGLSFADIHNHWKLYDDNLLKGSRAKNGHDYASVIDEIALVVLDKYNFELPKITLEAYNRYLKLLAAAVRIDKKLTTHVGRKTFATLQYEKGWSIESIATMLGHTSIRTTETFYLGKTLKRLELEIAQRKLVA